MSSPSSDLSSASPEEREKEIKGRSERASHLLNELRVISIKQEETRLQSILSTAASITHSLKADQGAIPPVTSQALSPKLHPSPPPAPRGVISPVSSTKSLHEQVPMKHHTMR